MFNYDFTKDSVFIVADFGGNEYGDLVSQKINKIKEACSAIGLSAKSAKDFRGGGKVILKIQEAIEDAEFIICDISEPRGHANANVYYEFGYAHGCENGADDLLTICDRATFDRLYAERKLPFDIQDEQIHKFGSEDELYRVIVENLSVMKEKSRRKK
jgi:hypothetical protein